MVMVVEPSPVFFTSYVKLVKNLRGVILFDPGDQGFIKGIEWLSKRFHYRNLGIPPNLSSYLGREYFEKKVFRKLSYPVKPLAEFSRLLVEAGLPVFVSESVVLSSVYISPLLLVTGGLAKELEEGIIGTVRVCRTLNLKDWKLHLRIADYSILDFYEEMVDLAIKYINARAEESRVEVIDERVKIAGKDMGRYWRITCKESSGKVFLYYYDPLKYLHDRGFGDRLVLEYAPGLSIIPVVNVSLAI